MNDFLKVEHISKKFNTIRGEINAIEDINFAIKEGDFVSIVGASGCGKSTLLSILAGLLEASSGRVVCSKNIPTIGYMLQEDALFEHYTIYENILLGLRVTHTDTKENKEKALALLKKYHLDDFKDKFPRELSGGMKQRVALIRTLALQPDILFLDEPFSALDYTTRMNVSDDVHKIIKESGKTTIMVTHDVQESVAMSDVVIVLSKSPAVVKNIYNISIDKNLVPSKRKKDENFDIFYEKVLKDLNESV